MAARSRHTTAHHGLAARISLGYALLAGLWVYASDALVDEMSAVVADGARLQIYKGWLFVAVTALLLYGVVLAVGRIVRSEGRPEAFVIPTAGEEVPRP